MKEIICVFVFCATVITVIAIINYTSYCEKLIDLERTKITEQAWHDRQMESNLHSCLTVHSYYEDIPMPRTSTIKTSEKKKEVGSE